MNVTDYRVHLRRLPRPACEPAASVPARSATRPSISVHPHLPPGWAAEVIDWWEGLTPEALRATLRLQSDPAIAWSDLYVSVAVNGVIAVRARQSNHLHPLVLPLDCPDFLFSSEAWIKLSVDGLLFP